MPSKKAEAGVAGCASCLILLVLTAALNFCTAWLLAWLWNQVMPALFHLPGVAWQQVLLVMAIITLIVGFIKSLFSGASR